MLPTSAHSREKGFTLVEVMIAVAFVSIALFGYIALQMRLIDSNERVLLKQRAVLKAESELAQRISTKKRSATDTLTEVSASGTWTDRSGLHTYNVDGVCAGIKVGW